MVSFNPIIKVTVLHCVPARIFFQWDSVNPVTYNAGRSTALLRALLTLAKIALRQSMVNSARRDVTYLFASRAPVLFTMLLSHSFIVM